MNIKELIPYLEGDSLKDCLSKDAFIAPFNPYGVVLSHRTSFRSYDLDLAKLVAETGVRVHIPILKGNDTKEIVLQKHFDLSNPVVLFIVGIPFTILTSVISSLVVHLVTKGRSPHVLIVKLSHEGDVEECYNEKGDIVSNEAAKVTIAQIRVTPIYTRPNPHLSRPVPIHFEHTSKVIGWGIIECSETEGLLLKDAKVSDDDTWQLIKTGKLVGFSIGGIAKIYNYSICHRNYFECEHIKGKVYNGVEAFCEIASLDLAEISIVSDPANVDARIQDVGVSSIR